MGDTPDKKTKAAGGRPRKYNEPTVLTNVRFPESTIAKLNKLCERGNKSRSELLNDIIGEQYDSLRLELSHEVSRGIVVVRIGGELNPADLEEAKRYVEECLLRHDPAGLVVDLGDAALVSSTAASWLVSVLLRLGKLGKAMALCRVSEENASILNLIGLRAAIPSHPDVESAVASLLPKEVRA